MGCNVLLLIYSSVAVCMFCTVRCAVIIGFSLLFSDYSTYVCINILFIFVLYFCFLFCVFYVLVLFCVLFLLSFCLSPIFVQVYLPLPPGGNPLAVNKYDIYHIYHFLIVGTFLVLPVCK